MEVAADTQLRRSRADPATRGTVLDSGLFGDTRRRNYFGEAVLQWGLFVMALDVACWTVFAPALTTFRLLRVSGVSLLDAHLSATRAGSDQYAARTSAFLPRRG